MSSPKPFLHLGLLFFVTLLISSHASACDLADSAAKAKVGKNFVNPQEYGDGGYGGGPGGSDNWGYSGGGYDQGRYGYGGDYGSGGDVNGVYDGHGGYGRRYLLSEDSKDVMNPEQYGDSGYGGGYDNGGYDGDGGYNRGAYGDGYGRGGYGGGVNVDDYGCGGYRRPYQPKKEDNKDIINPQPYDDGGYGGDYDNYGYGNDGGYGHWGVW